MLTKKIQLFAGNKKCALSKHGQDPNYFNFKKKEKKEHLLQILWCLLKIIATLQNLKQYIQNHLTLHVILYMDSIIFFQPQIKSRKILSVLQNISFQ